MSPIERCSWGSCAGAWRAALVLTMVCIGLLAGSAPAMAGFGLSKWEAGTCTTEGCSISTPEQFYTTAAGHPPFGITDFAMNTNGSREPEGHVEKVRVDIPPGLAVDPLATPTCRFSELESLAGCPADTKIGKVKLTAHVGTEIPLLKLKAGIVIEPPLPGSEATVYNMEPPPGHPLDAAFKVSIFETIVQIVGGIDPRDFHEYFTIENVPTNPELIESRLIFEGQTLAPEGTSPFITMPSICNGPQTTYIHVYSYEHQEDSRSFKTPVGASGCDEVPFSPSVKVTPANSQSDRSDGPTVKVEVPHDTNPLGRDDSTVRDAYVALPEGMTLNPAAASGLEACQDNQFNKGTANPITCPPGSIIGTTTIETPDLPAGSLTGTVYVGQPLSNSPESGQEYRIFIAAESARYGVTVRLEGHVSANAATGRLSTAVLEAPQVPFSDFILNFNSAHNPLANPLACGPAATNSTLIPYSGNAPAFPSEAFTVDYDGKGAGCPSPLPFNLTQAAAATPTTAGSSPTFAFKLERPEGRQYLSKLTTTLPPGLVGKITAVKPLCGEPQASTGECPAASEIGTAAVTVGSGPTPLGLSGRAYLTGPYGGQPYGLSVVVPAEKVGPYDYGKIVTRASVGVEPFSARIVVSSQLPTVVGGAPIRLRSLAVDVTRRGFMLNPTNCQALSLESTLVSTFGTSAGVSTPFQVSGCSALKFSPKLTASTKAKTSKRIGAALKTKIVFPKGLQANVKSVFVQLPKQLPARISTLNLACREATFNANPFSCPPGAYVGTVVVSTPVLPNKLIGSAVLVSHGGAAFPDMDLLLSGDGVHVILVGHTNIAKNITSSNFASLPDVPVSSVELKLPQGKKSALGAIGNLCKKALLMPTTITGQNGKVLKRRTRIAVAGCPHKHKHKHRKHHRHKSKRKR
ncbi:MAG TPA: hypothetical protein VFW38_00260 [Solirubrobacteraceae bacterium]|nr:hypothetical protein [Solirubrobacteraceae bacterium]